MIIWLASYPKSGNTLLRSILATYFYSESGTFDFSHVYKISQFPSKLHFENLGIDTENEIQIFKNFIKAQELINKTNPGIKFFKTHSNLCKVNGSDFTDLKNTLGVIYVVRDPRNVVTSFAHHYGYTINEATDAMLSKSRFLAKTDLMQRSFLGSWSDNYNSWKQLKLKKKYLLITYEDLVNKKKSTIIKIFNFFKQLKMQVSLDMVKMNKVIKTTNFEEMKKLEKKKTFYESPIDEKTGQRRIFFKHGNKNDWRLILDDKVRVKIEKAFHKEMKELNYL